jgi:pimeloyl-ACP methyl ester carboxylesterase
LENLNRSAFTRRYERMTTGTKPNGRVHEVSTAGSFMKVTFAHGLWSGPDSSKAAWMRDQGWEVVAIDMRKHGWDQASQTRAVLETLDEHGPFDLLIGSSFGGLATANAAAQRPELDLRLLLLAPAFGYPDLVTSTLGDAAMEAWKTSGKHAFHPPGWDQPVVLPWSFVEAARPLAWPRLPHPTVILHGTEDDVVPLENSHRAAAENEGVHVEEVPDDHRLHASLPHLLPLSRRLLSTP